MRHGKKEKRCNFLKGEEKIVSRVLSRAQVALPAVMIIHLGRKLPYASSDTTREHQTGRP